MRLIFLILCISSFVYANVNTTVSILPQKYFVKKIGGDKVGVTVMVQPGSSPTTYEPTSKQMIGLTKSDIYFSIAVPFEKRWLPRFKDVAKGTSFVDVSKGIVKQPIAKHSHDEEKHHEHEEHADHEEHDEHADHDEYEDHDEHQEDAHEHAGLDPHIWLSPKRVKIIAKNILNALVQKDGANEAYYKQNYKDFIAEISELDKKIKQNLAGLKSSKFIVFHPSWGYFAKDYALQQVAIEIEGKEPKQKDLVNLIELAKQKGIKAVFVAPEFSQKSAKIIADSIEGKTITVSPLHPKWDENLLLMSQKLKEVLD